MNYAIKQIRQFYGPRKEASIWESVWESSTFESAQAAKTQIRVLESARYELVHNESGRPAYSVVSTDSPWYKRQIAKRRW
jgi:hypothetical protein